jgi:hypothetical protein
VQCRRNRQDRDRDHIGEGLDQLDWHRTDAGKHEAADCGLAFAADVEQTGPER